MKKEGNFLHISGKNTYVIWEVCRGGRKNQISFIYLGKHVCNLESVCRGVRQMEISFIIGYIWKKKLACNLESVCVGGRKKEISFIYLENKLNVKSIQQG